MVFRPAMVSIPLSLVMAGFGIYLSQQRDVVVAPVQPTHPVTAEMLKDASRQNLRPAPAFRLVDARTKKPFDTAQTFAQQPTLVLFIKEGCPCSIEAQPVFNDLARAYAGKVQFLGITDAKPDLAREWAQTNEASFPVLSDPGLGAMKAYAAPRSAYFALVNLDGRIERFYPGYNKETIADVNDRIAKLVGQWPASVDLTHVPERPTSGCSYDGM